MLNYDSEFLWLPNNRKIRIKIKASSREESHRKINIIKQNFQNPWNVKSWRCTQLCCRLNFHRHFPFGHRAPAVSGQTHRQACGSCWKFCPYTWQKKHLTAPAKLPLKLAGLRLHFDFSLLGIWLKKPLILARKLEDIQCNRGEQTSY